MVTTINKSVYKTVFPVMIGFAVISFWRGIWGLSDTFLFPGNYTLSLFTSLGLGLGILLYTGYVSKTFF